MIIEAMPPWSALESVAERLRAAGLRWGLGGSGLLIALGLADQAHDWDLQTDAAVEEVEEVLRGLSWERSDASGCHDDHRLRLHSHHSDIIVRFAFATPGGRVEIPLAVRGQWRGVPLAAPEGWAVAYAWMGELEGPPSRTAKAEALLAYVEREGVDPGLRDRLLNQPLPDWMRHRLRRAPGRAPTATGGRGNL